MEKATIYDFSRMCKANKICGECPLNYKNSGRLKDCEDLVIKNPGKANEIILNWCKEHPVETRQDRFLKMFPNVVMIDDIIYINPCTIEKGMYQNMTEDDVSCPTQRGFKNCPECRKKYWLAEVDENE